MKRITLTLAVAGALCVPALLLTGSAGAANPHGDKSNPTAGCGVGGGKPSGQCSDPGLPQSEGCQNGQAAVQNPHCQVATPGGGSGLTPATPVSSPGNSGNAPGQGGARPAQGVAGAEAGNQASGNAGAATGVSGKQIDELPFTGLSDLWLALIGAGMLALGLVLRARTSSPTATEDPATDSPASGGEDRVWDVPELDIATPDRRRGVSLPLSEFEALGRLLIGNGGARLRAGPGGALFVAWDSG